MEKDTKRLRRQAEAAYRDAVAAEMDEEHEEAADFRAHARELEGRIAQLEASVVTTPGLPCLVCAGKRVVIGNGTYGGPAKRQRLVMAVV